MRKIALCSLLTAICAQSAHAAGTYYDGSYQSPQYRYGQVQPAQVATTRSSGMQYQPAQRYGQYAQSPVFPGAAPAAAAAAPASPNEGFYLNAGISYEIASWQMEMKQAGSRLYFNNINWYMLNADAGYNASDFKIEAGLKYGIQGSDGHMTDDDVTNGGYWIGGAYDDVDNFLGDVYGQTLSIGTTKGGSFLGFNAGVGLTNKLSLGGAKLTPSIGYRYTSYTLETKNNSGITNVTGYCEDTGNGGEVNCLPLIPTADGTAFESLDGSYTFYQPGTSHKYDVTWAGPYLALDLDYAINQSNAVNGRIEIGLPAYNTSGDQPYRPDWNHPKGVADNAGIGSAYHLGLGANYMTSITDSVMFTLGFTFDYFTVSNATAKTYLNPNYYNTLAFWDIVDGVYGGDLALAQSSPTFASEVDASFNDIKSHYESMGCSNWVCKTTNEIDSFYKSMGIRVGIAAKF